MGEIQAAFVNWFTKLGIHELVHVKLHLLSGVGRYVEDSRVHADRVFRTCLDTVPAVDADSQIDVKADGILFDVRVGVLPGHDGDASGRADCLAEHASDATRRTVFAYGKPVPAAEP